jgi:hypothetical protein
VLSGYLYHASNIVFTVNKFDFYGFHWPKPGQHKILVRLRKLKP